MDVGILIALSTYQTILLIILGVLGVLLFLAFLLRRYLKGIQEERRKFREELNKMVDEIRKDREKGKDRDDSRRQQD